MISHERDPPAGRWPAKPDGGRAARGGARGHVGRVRRARVRGHLDRRDRASRGISRPYVFRLFGTKKDVFKAAVSRSLSETLKAYEETAAGKRGSRALEAIASSYIEQLRNRPRLLGRLQASGGCDGV